jgi:L,D-transpeptidase YbiS
MARRSLAWLVFVIGLAWLPVQADVADPLEKLELERRQLLAALAKLQPTEPYIVVDTQDNQLQLVDRQHRVLRQAVCATGSGRKLEGPKRWQQGSFYTPKGRFSVLSKQEDPVWVKPWWDFVERGESIPVFAEDPRRFEYGVLGEYALYFAKGYMIHGTLYEINLGKSITHGCVRLGSEDLRYLYENVEKGWRVYIY